VIAIEAEVLERIQADGERRYPEECCGLLVGQRLADGSVHVAEAHASANLADHGKERLFEIDPALRFRVQRALAGTALSIVGHYHSHPDRAAEPSARDRARAFEPQLVWLITAVVAGRATETAAFLVAETGAERLDLVVRETDPGPA
jgi:proteasome lid subunit RPN8/RPN11